MEKLPHYPLRAQEDALKRALILGGFTLIDDDSAPEIEPVDWTIQIFERPSEQLREPIILEDGAWSLRSELLAAQLSTIKLEPPFRVFSAGSVYDGRDPQHPRHRVIQGIWADKDLPLREGARFGAQLVENVFGLGATVSSTTSFKDSFNIEVSLEGKSFTLATVGKATPIARALLGVACSDCNVWIFEIDVDQVTMAVYGYESRDELFSPIASDLKKHLSDAPTFGELYFSRASNELRKLGFCEFSGLAAYESDCYVKMNMIQEAWDTNNRGVKIDKPLGNYTGLPTVLTPALEEALAANWKAGEKECLLFEIRHIFLPNALGNPIEKVALSFGGYGPDLDKVAWRKLVDQFLSNFGIANHFFIPLPAGKAPAYNPADGWLLMDQRMTYLESNFGSISPVALKNHGIETDAFMAMFEFEPIAKKAAEDFDFVPNDYQ